jgi:hypothetical protein
VGNYVWLGEEQKYSRYAARISEIKQQYMSQELAMWKTAEPTIGKKEGQPALPDHIAVDESQEDVKQEQEPAAIIREGKLEQPSSSELGT